jgi:UDP-glucose 4-epimerase
MSRPNILITGGAGFIGSHLASRFCDLAYPVRVFDDFSTGKRENLASCAADAEIVEGDLRHPEECERACRDMDIVFHLAARPSVPVSVEHPVDTHEVNNTGTLNLLLAARANKCRRVIYAGSSSCYGESEVSPKHEALATSPLSPYAVQKLAGEHYCKAFHACYGIETLITRYFNVFGPRQDPKSQYAAVIPAFITHMLDDQPPTIFGDGQQTRDFTYIENILHAYQLAVEVPKVNGESINVACGGEISLLAIIEILNRILEKDIRPHFAPPRAGDVRHSCADISAARQLLGYEPIVSFEEGLRRTVEHFAALIR